MDWLNKSILALVYNQYSNYSRRSTEFGVRDNFFGDLIMSYSANNHSNEQLLPQNQSSLAKSDRSTIKTVPQRGNYEREVIYQILDEGLVCYVSFVVDGQPFVIPTAYGRVEDKLYIHGSPASRMLKALQTGIEVSVCITLVDGLVLARSAFPPFFKTIDR